ncbi:uncharacterized protein PAC_17454 [Phialocephala subalpina]|uniref:Heterokaryon incompatibility domain-containing protein n=1 Tax=Phialocephala subalpina TaxID=576137 RepID=A0A1L7XRC0_9HELO|nr:uncharacterized protein PAC_17454 [Phialocephala subalpina]
MFFKNGERIGEIVGTSGASRIQNVLLRLLPDLKVPETTEIPKRPATNTRQITEKKEEVFKGCQVCQLERIVKVLESHPSNGTTYHRHDIGIQKLAANAEKCNHCKFLIQTLEKDKSLFSHVVSVEGGVSILSKRDKGLARLHLEGSRQRGKENTDRFNSRFLQKLEDKAEDDTAHFSGRFVRSEVNFGLCRKWLRTCRKCHANTCHRETANLPEMGLKLIDINNRCIIKALADAKYAALSYVWGNAKQLMFLEETALRLTTAGGLSEKHSDIPKTIQDAMTVAARLNFDYLWIDALCIEQDKGNPDKSRQIAQMDKVYSCASVTIVSTGSDANTEIPGLRSPSRTPNQTVHTLGNIQLITSLPTLSQALKSSRWDHRGWTLQEKALSKRLLIFTESQVYWHCNAAIYAEDTNLELSKDTRSLTQIVDHYEEYSDELRLIYKPSPKISADRQYDSLVRSYMTRDLTVQVDAINAFTGILNALEPKLGTPHWGLPTKKFDGALLWRIDGHFPDRRRDKPPVEHQFPSWSWAGWIGGEDVYMNESGLDTISKIVWWKIDDDTGDWVKLNPDRATQAASEITNEFFGVDASLPTPNTDNITLESDKEQLPKYIPHSHLLRLWTSTARFTVGREPVRSQKEPYSQYHVYGPGQNSPVSRVVLDDKWRQELKGDLIDVIFLSRVGDGHKFKYDIRLWTLVVEWQGDVAYRVQNFQFPIRLLHWENAKPVFKLVTLA